MGSLHQCLREKRFHQLIYLVKLKTDLEELDDKLHTPLITICGSMENIQMASRLIKVLISNGANTEVEDEEGLSPLHLCCKRNKPELIRLLLRLTPDCSVNSTDMYGNTPLHYAAAHVGTAIVSIILPLLIRYRINTDVRNQLGFTPLLIAASNGRLDVARYISERVPVSTVIYDSLYFYSLDNWFRIYYDWPAGVNILSSKTEVTLKDNRAVTVHKENLVPVTTKPAVNRLLETFSRENSAAQSSKSFRTRKSKLIVPKIVVTQPSSSIRRARTAPPQRIADTASRRRCSINTRMVGYSRTINPHHRQQTVALSHDRDQKQDWFTTNSDDQQELAFTKSPRSRNKMNDTYWGSMVELAGICSDQLSDAYRRTIVPTWPQSEAEEEVATPASVPAKPVKSKDQGSRAASILLGMLGKGRRLGSESSNSAEDEAVSPKANIKSKLLKIGLKKVSSLTDKSESDEKTSEELADNERVEKAAAILNRVMLGKKKTAPVQTTANTLIPASL